MKKYLTRDSKGKFRHTYWFEKLIYVIKKWFKK